MRRPAFLARQGRCPAGLLGAVVGRIMAHETAAENAHAVELLDLEPGDHVLEVGFGHGRTVAAIADLVPAGLVAGVDFSPQMLRLASARNRDAIRRGQVALQLADSRALPYPDAGFDKLLAVHTIYFWDDAGEHMRELARVLRPQGTLVIGFRPAGAAGTDAFPPQIYRFRTVAEVCQLLAAAGFRRVSVTEWGPPQRRVVLVAATRAESITKDGALN